MFLWYKLSAIENASKGKSLVTLMIKNKKKTLPWQQDSIWNWLKSGREINFQRKKLLWDIWWSYKVVSAQLRALLISL